MKEFGGTTVSFLDPSVYTPGVYSAGLYGRAGRAGALGTAHPDISVQRHRYLSYLRSARRTPGIVKTCGLDVS
jgi:hypothetical protein